MDASSLIALESASPGTLFSPQSHLEEWEADLSRPRSPVDQESHSENAGQVLGPVIFLRSRECTELFLWGLGTTLQSWLSMQRLPGRRGGGRASWGNLCSWCQRRSAECVMVTGAFLSEVSLLFVVAHTKNLPKLTKSFSQQWKQAKLIQRKDRGLERPCSLQKGAGRALFLQRL